MSEILKFATAVVYADDVPQTVAFYCRVTGLEPTYYDVDLGFALLGDDQAVAIASHEAGMLMLANGYGQVRSNRVRGTELAFWTRDVAAAFQVAVEAGAKALTPPRVMPWGQTVAYVEAPEGTILGFVTRVGEAAEP
jgi:catechol 2,3-dioxygenase-like lactoylglutathione lyase family enzyme